MEEGKLKTWRSRNGKDGGRKFQAQRDGELESEERLGGGLAKQDVWCCGSTGAVTCLIVRGDKEAGVSLTFIINKTNMRERRQPGTVGLCGPP